ncbi:MAG: TonB-dependent receptor domain-containing protein [Flavobacteriaceae bacterium]
MKKIFLFTILICFSFKQFSQENLEGKILFSEDSKDYPVMGATVKWINTDKGTISNENGDFKLERDSKTDLIVISYVGFQTDTLSVKNINYITHYMSYSEENFLDEVTVSKRRNSAQRTYLMPQNIINISEEELLKAACCNLSESFETNPSVDVNHNDAITGTKQIEMLGLKSPYILITEENIPMVRGASQTFGLGFTPGTWIESIQVTKGMGSVTNGYESIVGQINTEIKKPYNDMPFFFNLFKGIDGRFEANAHLRSKVSDKIQNTFFIHYNDRKKVNDKNGDMFLDKPLQDQLNLLSKWQFTDASKGLVSFLNIRYLDDNKKIGSIDFNEKSDLSSFWGGEIFTNRFDSSFKLGYVNPNIPYQSLGFQLAYNFHDQESYYGLNDYNISQKSLFLNLIYNSIISNTKNKIKAGLNFSSDNYSEYVFKSNINRIDRSFGGFFEYSFDNMNDFNLIFGLRYDIHNNIGSFFTPRLHFRYMLNDNFSIKGSVGTGRKIANVFAENQTIFLSNRKNINKNFDAKLYGVSPEKATNLGFSLDHKVFLFGGQGNLIFDFYKTIFDNRVIIDFETFGEFNFYNSSLGKSKSDNYQIEFLFSKNNWNITAAYKKYDVKSYYQSGLKEKPLQPRNIIFFNYGIESNKVNESNWKFDITYNRLGKQRLMLNPRDNYEFTDPHFSINSQITRVFSSKLEVYVGGENLNNYKQENPIIMANDPFNQNFDASIIHGPIFGSTYYMGLRYKILN